MTIRLLGSRILLGPIRASERREKGIIIPARYADPATLNQFRVLAVGPGSWKPGRKYWHCKNCGWISIGHRAVHQSPIGSWKCAVRPQDRMLWQLTHQRVLVCPEVQPGDFVLLDGSRDYQTLYDGRLVVDESQLLAKWSAL